MLHQILIPTTMFDDCITYSIAAKPMDQELEWAIAIFHLTFVLRIIYYTQAKMHNNRIKGINPCIKRSKFIYIYIYRRKYFHKERQSCSRNRKVAFGNMISKIIAILYFFTKLAWAKFDGDQACACSHDNIQISIIS